MHHVQGLLSPATGCTSRPSTDTARKGYLFEHDLKTGIRLRTVEIQQGPRYHPGGFDADDISLYIPVAEYRATAAAPSFNGAPGTRST